jgi:hypothetical protein
VSSTLSNELRFKGLETVPKEEQQVRGPPASSLSTASSTSLKHLHVRRHCVSIGA